MYSASDIPVFLEMDKVLPCEYFFFVGAIFGTGILKFNLCGKISAQIGCLNILLYLFLHGFLLVSTNTSCVQTRISSPCSESVFGWLSLQSTWKKRSYPNCKWWC